MIYAQARWLVLVGLCGSAFLACSSDPATPAGTAGTASGGSAAGNAAAGSPAAGSPAAGNTSTGGQSTAGTAGAGTAGGGAGGTAGGAGGSGGATGGSGGAAAGSGGSTGGGGSGGAAAGSGGAGGSGGGAAMPTAVAMIMGINGKTVTGTGTFTQGATMTKLVINLTACVNGPTVSHLHANHACGPDGGDAGGHWKPQGEMLGGYMCVNGTATHEVSKPTSDWTVGDGSATDVTKYSLMVHDGTEASPGGKIGCGVIDKKP